MIEKFSPLEFYGMILLLKEDSAISVSIISLLMIMLRLNKLDSKIQEEILSLFFSKSKNYPKKRSTQYTLVWVLRNNNITLQKISQSVSILMSSEETVWSMMLMISQKPTIDINSALN